MAKQLNVDKMPKVDLPQGEMGRPVIRRFLFRQAFGWISARFGGEPRARRRAMAWSLAKRNMKQLAKGEAQKIYRGAHGLPPLPEVVV